jgi:hypothetical protein
MLVQIPSWCCCEFSEGSCQLQEVLNVSQVADFVHIRFLWQVQRLELTP